MPPIVRHTVTALCLCLCGSAPLVAQLRAPEKISFSDGFFIDRLSDLDQFGSATASLGDLDGDGVGDLAVGSPLDDDGGTSPTSNLGAVWVLFLRTNGTVKGHQKISSTRGGFSGDLDENDQFGSSVASTDDLNGDGISDLVVGAPNDDDGGRDRGAIWILLMNRDGTVKNQIKVSNLGQELAGGLEDNDHFGSAVAALGGRDDGGTFEIAVGAPDDDDGGADKGSVWILGISPDGMTGVVAKISSNRAGFDGLLDEGDRFGSSIAGLPDANGNGRYRLAIGAPFDDDGATSSNANRGAVWILGMSSSGEVDTSQKISATAGAFGGELDDNDHFGASITALGDLDRDGNPDLLVGSSLDDDGGTNLASNRGAAWILFSRPNGTAGRTRKLSEGSGDFSGALDENDQFGAALTALGDLDGDDVVDIAVGAPLDDDGGASISTDRGAVWILFLRPDGTTRPVTKISSVSGDFTSTLDDNDLFGWSLTNLGEMGLPGRSVLAVGAPGDDDGGRDAGAVWLLFTEHGSVRGHKKLSSREGDFPEGLDVEDRFGTSVAWLGDLPGGSTRLAVGAPNDDDGGIDAGGVWILMLGSDGRVESYTKLAPGLGGLTGSPGGGDHFGTSVAAVGDLDGDGVTDMAVGAPDDDDGFTDAGAVWILFLNRDGAAKSHEKISNDSDVVGLTIRSSDRFGAALAMVGDRPGDGVANLAVGAPEDDVAGPNEGATWLLAVNSNGSVDSAQRLADPAGHLADAFLDSDHFGISIAPLGDLDDDGAPDVAVGSVPSRAVSGVVTAILLNPDATVKSYQKHGAASGDFIGQIQTEAGFGMAMANLGDLDGDGIGDLGVGAPFDDDGGIDRGAVWISHGALIPPPSIDQVLVSPDPPRPGERLTVSARIVAPNGVRGAAINFRSSGDADFLTAPLNPTDDQNFGLTIPAFVTGSRGIEYFVTAENLHGQQTRSPSSGIVSLPVSIPDGVTIPLVAGEAADAYRLLSVPIDLENRSARTMLEDDLGQYNDEDWRFFGYSQDVHRVELNVHDLDLIAGAAFWLLVRETGRIITTGPGKTVPTDRPYEIPLRSGWNYVGNPFNFSVPLSRISTRSGQPLDARTYTGVWETEDRAFESTVAYAVFNDGNESDTLVVNPDLSGIHDDTVSSVAGKVADESEWSIRIRARSGRARDVDNVAAVSTSAASGWDILDRPEPPVVGDYVSVSFPHPEWNRIATRFCTDTRRAGEEGFVWTLEVRTASPARVDLSFEDLESVSSLYEIWLIDEEMNTAYDLRERNRYSLASMGDGRPRFVQLAVVSGSLPDDEVVPSPESPARFGLYQNYPNPFSGVTTIRYSLAEASPVTLTVLNVLGERIATLVRGIEHEAGFHHYVWDGRTDTGTMVSSGTYLLQIKAGPHVAMKSAIVVK